MQRATQAYLQTGITTTGQGDILIMLYDGAIKFMNMAKERLAANDMAGKGNNIRKALDIIEELKATLDIDKGGAIAENLRGLYTFCGNRLVMANIKKSPEIIDEALKVMSGLRSAFAAIVDLPEAREAAQQVAAGQRATGILPMRAQSGTTAAAPAQSVAAPGASAKFRSFYAKNQQAMENHTPAEHVPAPEKAEEQFAATPTAQSHPSAAEPAIFSPAPSAEGVSSSAAAEAHAPQATVAAEDLGMAFPVPPAGGFGAGRMGGSALYRKISQQ